MCNSQLNLASEQTLHLEELRQALTAALPADAGTEAYPAPHYGSCGATCLYACDGTCFPACSSTCFPACSGTCWPQCLGHVQKAGIKP